MAAQGGARTKRKELSLEQKIKARERARLWRINNPERYSETKRKYNKTHKHENVERARLWSEKNRERSRKIKLEWKNRNRLKIRLEIKKKLLLSKEFRLEMSARAVTRNSLKLIKNRSKNLDKKFPKWIGCSVLEFKNWIESRFEPWMNWGKPRNRWMGS